MTSGWTGCRAEGRCGSPSSCLGPRRETGNRGEGAPWLSNPSWVRPAGKPADATPVVGWTPGRERSVGDTIFVGKRRRYSSLIFICTAGLQPAFNKWSALVNSSCFLPCLLRPAYPRSTCSSETRRLITICCYTKEGGRERERDELHCHCDLILLYGIKYF